MTERYRAQQDLAASEERFRTAVNALMDPFFILGPVRDDQGQVVELEYRYANQAALQLYQMPWQDVVGHGQLELFPSVRELGVWDTYVESIQTGLPARIDLPHFDEHGVAGSFQLAATPAEQGLIVTVRDVTEARRAQEALRVSEERFRASVELLPDAFAVLSAVRGNDGTIVDFRYEYVNATVCRFAGQAREELLGQNLFELTHTLAELGLLAAYAAAVETGEPCSWQDLDDENVEHGRPLDIWATKLADGLVVTWRDVSERRRREATVARQHAELELAAAELEDRVRRAHRRSAAG